MVTGTDAVAGQAQDIANAHRGPAQDVTLDGDTILVAAGDLHDRRRADPGEQGTNSHTRHVAVGSAAIRRIDGIDITMEDPGAAIDILRIGGVGWSELARARELTRAQHALETSRRGVTWKD